MKKEVKSRKHILCEKSPLVAMFLAAVFALLFLSIPWLIGLSDAAGNLASSVLAVLFLIAYTRWFAPELKGVFKTSHLATGLAFVWLAFAFKFFGAYFVNLADSGFCFKPSLVAFAMAIAAGFYEETIFRGVTVPIGMRYFKSEKRVGILVLISALVFGLMHIGNIVNGASIQMGIAQGIATTFAGIFFIAVYLRTGNILIPIFMHGIFDYMCFTTDPALENGIMANNIATNALILAVLVDVIAGIWGLYLIRPAKIAEIHAIWNDKWSVNN
ncbi:MAG: CPBP family intramembrane metalloprotease [Oscillospiraceae bacterium]|nr:CPBP family intramembrane metalloprotease [Oscillospiraceae bacterium]